MSGDGTTWTTLNHKEPNERRCIRYARRVMVGTPALSFVRVREFQNLTDKSPILIAQYKRGGRGQPAYDGGVALERRRKQHTAYYTNTLKEKRYGQRDPETA